MIVKGHTIEMRIDVFMFIPPGKQILVPNIFRACVQVASDLVDLSGGKGIEHRKIVKDVFRL